MNEIRLTDKSARICFKFYFTGHGCTFSGSNLLTNMVMIDEGEGYVPIEEMLRKLSRKSNFSVSAILDCCRNEISAKSKVEKVKPDFGQLSIIFGCKQGRISTITDGRSILTKAFIDHFEDPQIQGRPFPNIALLGFAPIASYAEHVNNTSKCYRIYEAQNISEKTGIKAFLAYIATTKLGRKADALDRFAVEFEDNFVDTVLQLQQMPDSDWSTYKIPPALQRTICSELDSIGGGRQIVGGNTPLANT